ncbi:MAG TPA: hypothetical protein VFJ92_01030 [Gemmatimonadales bacterium]|jgi:hypothetical protein|nr:hypothetical protein [Gemmatimonadales bacterium]
MFAGSPLPLHPPTSLAWALGQVLPGERLGAWVRGIGPRVRRGRVVGAAFALSGDLGALLRRCDRIAVRRGAEPVVLPAEELIGLRVLEIVLGLPYLPEAERLHTLYPGLRCQGGVLALPVGADPPEEVLGRLAQRRIPVAASRIRYLAAER